MNTPYNKLRRAELAGQSEVTLSATEATEILNDRQRFETTLDRDVRLSEEQINASLHALRLRKRQLTRSIEKATDNARAGARIQHGTHDANVRELAAISETIAILDVARQQIAHRLATAVGLPR